MYPKEPCTSPTEPYTKESTIHKDARKSLRYTIELSTHKRALYKQKSPTYTKEPYIHKRV